MKVAYNPTAGEGRGPDMCSGCQVCFVTQPHMLTACVQWKVRPKSTKQTIYARVAAAESRMNLRLQEILSECDGRSEMHSPKVSNFQKSTSQSCRDFHAVCKTCPDIELCDKMRFQIIGARCNRSVDFFRERFYSRLTLVELHARMQPIVDSCGCHAIEQSNSRDLRLVSSLPIPYCAKCLLYVDFIHGLPRFGGYDSCLVVTCGVTLFTHEFGCNKKITGEQTLNVLVEQGLKHYGASKEVHSDEDVRILSDTGWYTPMILCATQNVAPRANF